MKGLLILMIWLKLDEIVNLIRKKLHNVDYKISCVDCKCFPECERGKFCPYDKK